jgi:hypothetical protein
MQIDRPDKSFYHQTTKPFKPSPTTNPTMAKKQSTKQGKAPKGYSNQSDDTTRVARDPVTLCPPTITQNTPTDGTHTEPVVPPNLSNEPSPPSTPNRGGSVPSGNNPAGNTAPKSPPKPPTNPTTVPIDTSPEDHSADGTLSVQTVDSNGNTIDASRDGTERVEKNLANEMNVEVEDKMEVEVEEMDVEVDDVSEILPAVDIQWDEYTYESAAEEEKNTQSDDSPCVLPPPQDFLERTQVQAESPRQSTVMSEEENFYFCSGRNDVNPTAEDENIAFQLQLDEYKTAPGPTDAQPPTAPEPNVTAQNVYDSLESLRKDIVLKMNLEGKACDDEQTRFNNRINASKGHR